MFRSLKLAFPFTLGILTLMSQLQAASTWNGATSDLTVATNWTPNTVPTGDVATFPAGATTTSPTLTSGETLNLSEALFPATGTAYNFSIFGNPNPATLSFGSSPSSGVGVNNITSPSQNISFTANGDFAVIEFDGSSSADFANSGKVFYQIGAATTDAVMNFFDNATAGGNAVGTGAQITVGDFTASTGSSGILNFHNTSSAGYATIQVGKLNSASSINFSDTSTAQNANITIGNVAGTVSGTGHFSDSSTAANAQFTLRNHSEVDFNNNSTAASSQFSLDQSVVDFNDNSTAANAQFTLTDESRVEFGGSSTAANAVVTATNVSEVDFSDSSTAENAQISLDASIIGVFGNATMANAVVTATNGSQVDFNDSSLGGTSSIELTNNSEMTLGEFDAPVTSLTIGSLTADATSSVNLYDAMLTVSYNGATPIAIAGVINDLGGGMTTLGGSFTKSGTGTLVLSGANTYSGLTTVSQGNLVLNGSVFGDALVNLGAILSGTGTVGGNATVNGSIAPGNSIGTLNVVGNYTQNVGSTYFLEINGLGQTDLINVTGAATLNGGQVIVTSLDGAALSNTPYTILTAAGGVTGQFAGVSTTNLLLTPALTYDANHAYLVFSQTVFHFDAVTPNQIAVATQLESITNPTAEEFLILSTLAALPADAQQRALDEMSGVQYTSLNLASEIAARQFIRRLYDPLRSIVTSEPCNDCCYECPCPTLDVWFEAGGGQTFLDGNANARGLKLNGWEVTAGVQSTFNRDWTVGIAGTYIEDQIKYDIGGTGKNRMGFGAFYGLYRPSNFYVLADAAFGGGEFTVNRSIDIGVLAYSAKGRPKHFQAIGYIEGGFDWNTCNFLIQPFLGFEGGYFRRNTFSETGTSPLNLNINKQAYGHFFSRLGVHLTTEQWSSLKLSVDVAWDCRLSSLKHSVTEQFQSFGNSFVISGVPGNRNSIDAAATISTKLCGGWELYAEVGGEFWSKVSTYNVLGGVKYSW